MYNKRLFLFLVFFTWTMNADAQDAVETEKEKVIQILIGSFTDAQEGNLTFEQDGSSLLSYSIHYCANDNPDPECPNYKHRWSVDGKGVVSIWPLKRPKSKTFYTLHVSQSGVLGKHENVSYFLMPIRSKKQCDQYLKKMPKGTEPLNTEYHHIIYCGSSVFFRTNAP